MSYAHEAIEAIKREANWSNPTHEENILVAMYALLARTKGKQTTAEDVHDAWSLTCALSTSGVHGYLRPDHFSVVPFDELAPEKQAMDEPFAEAIRKVARKYEEE